MCHKFRLTKRDDYSRVNFLNVLRTDFMHADPKSVKDTQDLTVLFYAFGIYERKSCV